MTGSAPRPRVVARTVPLALLAAGLLAPGPASAATGDAPPWADLARTPVTADMARRATLDLVADPLVLVVDPFALDPATSVRGLARESTGLTTLTSDLLFAFDSAELTPAARTGVAEVAATLPQGAAVAVDGHTDGLGGDEVNLPLSQARAQAVADVLVATRPDLALTVTGHGSTQPVAQETAGGRDDPTGRALNRRVELRVTG